MLCRLNENDINYSKYLNFKNSVLRIMEEDQVCSS